MTQIVGNVLDVGLEGTNGTMTVWAGFRPEVNALIAPTRKTYDIEGGVIPDGVNAVPGPAVIVLDLGVNAYTQARVTIPDQEQVTIQDLFMEAAIWGAWRPYFMREVIDTYTRATEAMESAEEDAAAAAAAEARVGIEHEHVHQDVQHVDQVAAQVSAALDRANVFAQDQVPPYLQQEALNDTYGTKADVGQAREQWVQPWAHTMQPPTPKWSVSLNPTTGVVSTAATGPAQTVHPDLKVQVVVPPSGKLRYTAQAAVRAPVGGSLSWCLRMDMGAGMVTHPQTFTTIDAIPTGVPDGPPRLTTATGELSTDPSGAPLKHGAVVTIALGHNFELGTGGSGTGKTIFGGRAGTGSIIIEPVRAKTVMEQTYTATIVQPSATTFNPLWLCADRETILGVVPDSANWRRIAWSNDDCATWEANDTWLPPPGVQQARETGDGEIILATGAHPGYRCALWRSVGWSTNRKTATFVKLWEDSGAADGRNSSWEGWSLSQWGRYIVAAPYGAQGDATMPSMGRYVWFSEDHGKSGRIIFDLADFRPDPFYEAAGDTANWYRPHLHGVAYDPWWDAIWVCGGDYAANGTWVSFDHGETWQEIDVQQCTTILPMADAILMVTDSSPSQTYRIPRTARTALRAEPTMFMGATLTDYGTMMFRNADDSAAPVLAATTTAGIPGPGRILATIDGVAWRHLWVDNQSYAQRGVRSVMGPTRTGKIHARLMRAGVGFNEMFMVVLTPNA